MASNLGLSHACDCLISDLLDLTGDDADLDLTNDGDEVLDLTTGDADTASVNPDGVFSDEVIDLTIDD